MIKYFRGCRLTEEDSILVSRIMEFREDLKLLLDFIEYELRDSYTALILVKKMRKKYELNDSANTYTKFVNMMNKELEDGTNEGSMDS